MIDLPHGCKCSAPVVNPSNWKTCGKSALKKPWRITYRFYDPAHKDTPLWGKQIPLKGINRNVNVLHLWEEVCQETGRDDYLFSKGLDQAKDIDIKL